MTFNSNLHGEGFTCSQTVTAVFRLGRKAIKAKPEDLNVKRLPTDTHY
jgi:hypothetical protein